MAIQTTNLQNWIKRLEKLLFEVSDAAFEDTRVAFEDKAHDLFWQVAEQAISDTVEYNIPMFKEPLKKAIMTKGCITFYQVGIDGIAVKIDLDVTAGNIEIYANAVRVVRDADRTRYSAKSVARASEFWEAIYRNDSAVGSSLYSRIIEDRLSLVGGLAPYWSIIDDGSYYVTELDRGGSAYPRFFATYFVHTAEKLIEKFMSAEYRKTITRYQRALEEERYGGKRILSTITRVLGGANTAPLDVGGILRVIEINSRNYQLYVTQTSKVGMRLQ